MPTCVVVGNPKPASRTLGAATALMEQLTGRRPDTTIDVIGLGAGLLGWGDPKVAEAVATVNRRTYWSSPPPPTRPRTPAC